MPDVSLDLASTENFPPPGTFLALNMIVGGNREPYLAASLESLAKHCDWAVVNLNGDETAPGFKQNLDDILASKFNQEDRLTIVGLPFRNFAFQRNVCLEASRNAEWILLADADEVYYDQIDYQTIVRHADTTGFTRVLGHFWHFLKSHEYVHNTRPDEGLYFWTRFFKNHPQRYCAGAVHEKFSDIEDRDFVLDFPLFAHFGYIDPVRCFEKWVHYSNMSGRQGEFDNYFNDPRVPWRKGPENVLDDREGYALTEFKADPPVIASLPRAMNDYVLDRVYHVHKASCADHHGPECCGHDPLVTALQRSLFLRGGTDAPAS